MRRRAWVSGQEESHRPALAEPGGNFSVHPAPIVQPLGRTPSRQCANNVTLPSVPIDPPGTAAALSSDQVTRPARRAVVESQTEPSRQVHHDLQIVARCIDVCKRRGVRG
jgi:hypothetical protein